METILLKTISLALIHKLTPAWDNILSNWRGILPDGTRNLAAFRLISDHH